MRQPYVRYYGTFSDGHQDLRVYGVDAPYIRRTYPGGIEFFAGHHQVYNWIPEGEVWIDSAFPPSEVEYIVGDHELPEHFKMKIQHMLYEAAHTDANKIELRARRAHKPSISIRST